MALTQLQEPKQLNEAQARLTLELSGAEGVRLNELLGYTTDLLKVQVDDLAVSGGHQLCKYSRARHHLRGTFHESEQLKGVCLKVFYGNCGMLKV